MDDIRPAITPGSTRFLDCIRKDMRGKGYAYQTEKTYVDWIRRFILFHGKKHPEAMNSEHINQFLSHLGHDRHCSATAMSEPPRSIHMYSAAVPWV